MFTCTIKRAAALAALLGWAVVMPDGAVVPQQNTRLGEAWDARQCAVSARHIPGAKCVEQPTEQPATQQSLPQAAPKTPK
jgi:hypothetical protein